MTINEMMALELNVRVCDILKLFFDGYNDKLKFDLVELDMKHWTSSHLLSHKEITSFDWQPYYECVVDQIVIQKDCGGAFVTLVIEKKMVTNCNG